MVTLGRFALMVVGFLLLADGCGTAEATQEAYDKCLDFNYGHGGPAANGEGGQGGSVANACTPECTAETAAKDCAALAPDPRCGSVVCVENKCARQIKPGPIPSQKYGDCKQAVCDGAGNLIEIGDDTDYYNDGNQCTVDFCKSGAAHFVMPDGVQCPETDEGFCYNGECVECIDTLPQATCKGAGMVCDSLFWCVPAIDCMGKCGGDCAPCAIGQVCVENADCISGVCVGGMCQFPTCADGVKNDGETGKDCGAPSCADCPPGEGCVLPEDCLSSVCMWGICQAPTCIDGVKNGDEEGIDCGGSCGACFAQWEKKMRKRGSI